MRRIDDLNWFPLSDAKEHDIPQKSGIYFIRTGNGKVLSYPEDESRLFYIGQSVNLRQRLRTHSNFHNEAKQEPPRKLDVYYTRYEYSSRFEGEYAYVLGENPKSMESEELEAFALKHFSFPMGNSAGSWKSLNQSKNV